MKNASKVLYVYSIVCLVFLLSACNKKNDYSGPLVPGDYIYQRQSDFSPIRLFTKKGEIIDAQLINYYKVKFAQFILPLQSTNGSFINDTFHVTAIDKAKYNYMYKRGDTVYCSSCPGGVIRANPTIYKNDFNITKIDNYLQFSGTDTLNYPGSIDSFNIAIQLYKPYFKVTPLPASSGFGSWIETFKYFYALYNNNSLVFPGLNYINFKTHYTIYPPSVYTFVSSYSTIRYNVNNVFDASVLQRLSSSDTTYKVIAGEVFQKDFVSDTLLIQTYNTYYVK